MEDLNTWLGYARQIAGTAGDIRRGLDGPTETPGLTPEQEKLREQAAARGVTPWWQQPKTLAIAGVVLVVVVYLLKKK